MQTLTQIKSLLESRGLSPRKSLGQNFLIDHNLITRLIDAAAPKPAEPVLEVGPGTGALTDALLAAGLRVVACELDGGLAGLLRQRLAANARFELVEGDCLARGRALNNDAAAAIERARVASGAEGWSLIANLPYQAATPLMLALLMHHPRCHTLAVTVQREVAQRLAAPHVEPGARSTTPDRERHYGLLSVVAQSLATVEKVATLPPECFWPRPEVTSAMVVLRRRPVPLTLRPEALAGFCQRLFAKRRKQLGAILGRDFPFPSGIAPQLRPENLSPAQLVGLQSLDAATDRADRRSTPGPG